MINPTQILSSFIEEIEKSPGSLMGLPDFKALKNLLKGYLWCLQDITGIPFNFEISKWIQTKGDRKTSLIWAEYVYLILAKEDEELAYKLLISNLKDFLKEVDINSLKTV